MKKLFSLTLSLLMLIACSLGTVSAFAAEGEEPTPVDLRDCTVTLQYASTTYTGKALRPTVKVQYNDIALVQGQDYKVQYSANTACGTAQVKLTGTGDYTGAVSRSFKILPGRVTGMSTSRTTTTITMNWKHVPGAAVYRVYQSTSANGNYSKVATVSGNKAKISKLSAGKKILLQDCCLRQKGRLLRRSPQRGTEYRHPSLHRVHKERDQVRHQFEDPVEQGNLLRL